MQHFLSYGLLLIAGVIKSKSLIVGVICSNNLDFFTTFLLVFVSTFLADEILFYLGSKVQLEKLSAYVFSQDKIDKIFIWLDSNTTFFILIFRFLNGTGIVVPLIIGSIKFSFYKRFFLNLTASLIWSVFICLLGFYIKHFL